GPRPVVARCRRPPVRDPHPRGLRLRASALHHVLLGHDRKAQGHHAHDRRVHGRNLVHPLGGLRHQARVRRLLDGRGHRLGHRSLLYRLRTAGQRHHLGALRGHPRHTPSRALVGDRREVQGLDPLLRADGHSLVHEVGTRHPGEIRSVQPAPARQCGRTDQPRSLDVVPRAHRRHPVVDTWWQTENGSILISPLPGATATKPGSAMRALPGIVADVFDDEGRSVEPGNGGYLVIKEPWPSMLRTLWGDEERYKKTYWSQYPEVYFAG